jgi:hypothetical protein
LRCLLDKENDDLAAHLNWELPWRRKNQTTNIDSWYHDFSAYRNQVMHRTIYFLFKTPGNNYLPDDPTFLGDEPIRPVFDEDHNPYSRVTMAIQFKNTLKARENCAHIRIGALKKF